MLAFIPPSGLTGADGPERESLAHWLSPCQLGCFQLTGAEFQDFAASRLEAGKEKEAMQSLKALLAAPGEDLIQARPLSDTLLELRVKESDSKVALILCQTCIDYLTTQLNREFEKEAGEAASLASLQSAEEQMVKQEEKFAGNWLSDGSRRSNRVEVLRYAQIHYQEALVAKRELSEEIARRQALLERNRPIFTVVVPPEPVSQDSP